MPQFKSPRHSLQKGRQLVKAVLSGVRWEPHFVVAAVLPILLATVLLTLRHSEANIELAAPAKLFARTEDVAQCRVDSSIQDTCSFVREHCADFDDDGLIPYTQLYYCVRSSARPVLLTAFVAWLVILFAGMAAAASDYLSLHLAVIVSTLDISQNLAGVTIFAFGNGSSDLFSTLAAMKSNSGSLAITELFGAAAFINSVVLGLVAITRPFSVTPSHFVGEVVWFILSATSLVAFLADGQLVLAECLGIIGLYLAFVAYALLRPKREADLPTSATTAHLTHDDPRGGHRDDHSEDETDENTGFLDTNQHLTNNFRRQSGEALMEGEQTAEASTGTPQDEDVSASSSEAQPYRHSLTTNPLKRFLTIFPPLISWPEQSAGEKLLTFFSIPLLIPIGLTTPADTHPLVSQPFTDPEPIPSFSVAENAIVTHPHQEPAMGTSSSISISNNSPTVHQIITTHWPLFLQHILGPQFLNQVLIHQTPLLSPTTRNYFLTSLPLLVFSLLVITTYAYTITVSPTRSTLKTKLTTTLTLYNSFLAFSVSTTWIYLIASTAVTLLKTLGLITRLPTSVLGATVFAIGNSSNDLVANPAVARRGYPVLAASACLGGPMLNMLLGVGIGGLVQVLKEGSGGVYRFAVVEGLFVSAVALVAALVIVLAYAFWSGWRLDARVGGVLIGVWCVATVVNIAVDVF